MRLGLLTAFTVALLLPLAAGAQSLGGLGNTSANAFTLAVSPESPSPYSQVAVSVSSDSIDLTNATLTVSLAGKEIYKGAVHTFSVPLGKTGSIANVKVTISSGGTLYSQTLPIQPQDVVLIAEPLSSAPPLYLGKPSVPLQGDVRVVAMASLKDAGGNSSSAATYSYSWTVGEVQIADSSGIGKSSIVVSSPLQYRASEVSVVVTNASGTLTGGAKLSLSAQEPFVRVYENDPLLGIRYEHALLGPFTISGAETTLYAAPFSLPMTGGAPLVQWFLNGSLAQTGNSITLRPTGSGRGSASLSLTASAGNSTTATTNLSLLFGATSGTNLFGL